MYPTPPPNPPIRIPQVNTYTMRPSIHEYSPDSFTFNHHYQYPNNSTNVDYYPHIDYEVNGIVGQIEKIYSDLRTNKERNQLRAIQQWVQMYSNTGESMNKCVYDIIKKAIKHIRADLIGSANKNINDVIPPYSSISNRIENDADATRLDRIAAYAGDLSLAPAHVIRTGLQYFIQKLKNISDACDDPRLRTYYNIYRLVINTFPDSMNFYGIPVGRLLVWVHSLDDLVKDLDKQYFGPILEFHSEMTNYLSKIKDFTETVEKFAVQYNFINELSENDHTFYRNKIRDLWSWVINEDNVKMLQDIHDIIGDIKNPNIPSFPKDATKTCEAHNNAFGNTENVNNFIQKIQALNEGLDKIPKDACFQNHNQAGFGGKRNSNSRNKHYHRHNSDSSSLSSKSISITNTYSYSSKHKPRHKHN